MKKYKTLAISAALSLSILAGCSTADVTASSEDVVTANNTVVVTSDETSTATTSIESVAVATAVEANATSHDATTDYEYNEDDVVEIALGTSITEDSDAVDVDGTTVTISAAGTYRISGSLSDGQVIVDAGDEAVVQLILDNADITNADGAAIAVMSAETAIVILADGSVNTLADGATYVFAEGEDEPNATLYSTSDLTITGEGALYVQASYNDGIASKDGLVIDSGDITVEAIDDGIRGKDYVVVSDGTLDITQEATASRPTTTRTRRSGTSPYRAVRSRSLPTAMPSRQRPTCWSPAATSTSRRVEAAVPASQPMSRPRA